MSNCFRPTAEELDDTHPEYINPDVFARELADFLKDGLSRRGYTINFRCSEDWGYWQEIEHGRNYELAIGCANLDEYNDGLTMHHVFVRPSRPTIRPIKRWFRKTDVRVDVEALVSAIGDVLRCENSITDIKFEEPI